MMQVNLKNMVGMVALGMTLLSNTVPTWAGYVSPQGTYGVSIGDFGSNQYYVGGTMVGARYSPDNQSYIGCSIYASASSRSITCSARDGVGKTAVCMSTDPGYVEAIQGMSDSSYIVFKVDLASSLCKKLHIADYSSHLK